MTALITTMTLIALSAEPAPEAYLFAHMLKQDYGRLYYSVSRDGLHWTLLNGGKRITDDYRGHPDICLGHDGRYYLIGNYSTKPEITIWVSDDLVTWKRHTQFTPHFDGIPDFTRGERHNGAPKIYYDQPLKIYLITWHTPTKKAVKEKPEQMWSSMKTLYVTSKTLGTFSEPRRLFGFDLATIDTIVRRAGDKCYAVIKDERMPSDDWPTGKTIRVCVAEKLLGPYGPPGPALTTSFCEAPALIQRPGGKGWYLYCERYPGIRYECLTAPSPGGPWECVPRDRFSVPRHVRHGSMMAISAAQYEALAAAFPE